MMEAMLANPMFQQNLEMMRQNPQLLQNMLASHPMLAGNPGLAAVMSNPAFMQRMLDPATIRASLAMRRAQRQMQQAGVGAGLGSGQQQQQQQQQQQAQAMQQLFQQMQMGAAGAGLGAGAGGGMFGGLGGAFGAPSPVANPEVAYASQVSSFHLSFSPPLLLPLSGGRTVWSEWGLTSPRRNSINFQLSTLESMGFVDRSANIRALQATGGNVQAALDRLLSGN